MSCKHHVADQNSHRECIILRKSLQYSSCFLHERQISSWLQQIPKIAIAPLVSACAPPRIVTRIIPKALATTTTAANTEASNVWKHIRTITGNTQLPKNHVSSTSRRGYACLPKNNGTVLDVSDDRVSDPLQYARLHRSPKTSP